MPGLIINELSSASIDVILVEPQMAENIGAVARVMSNFGLARLVVVNPRDPSAVRSAKATAVAKHGANILYSSQITDSIESAVSEYHLLFATTANLRALPKQSLTARAAAHVILEFLANPAASSGYSKLDHTQHSLGAGPLDDSDIHSIKKQNILPTAQKLAQYFSNINDKIVKSELPLKIALIFGRENSGLNNEETMLAHYILTIPTAKNHSSLNLAQAVAIVAYEIFELSCQVQHHTLQLNNGPAAQNSLIAVQNQIFATEQADSSLDHLAKNKKITQNRHKRPANFAEINLLLSRLMLKLEKSSFFAFTEKKAQMHSKILNILLKSQLTLNEVKILHGIIQALSENTEI